MLRGFLFVIVYLPTLFLLLFLPAGRCDMPMGWTVLGIYSLISLANLVLVDPELITERLRMGGPGSKGLDRLIAAFSFFFFMPLSLVVAGLDAGRFHWTSTLPSALQIPASLVCAMGWALGSWSMATNKYFSTFVRIQTDRNHEVISHGPYAIVRHPGYAGTILASLAMPVALGSWWACIPAIIGGAGFVLRTVVEDRYLIQELPGYKAYAAQTRYRLLPGVW